MLYDEIPCGMYGLGKAGKGVEGEGVPDGLYTVQVLYILSELFSISGMEPPMSQTPFSLAIPDSAATLSDPEAASSEAGTGKALGMGSA